MRIVKVLALLVLLVMALMVVTAPIASAEPPGPGSKICKPGQTNVGGGSGNSGPGDKPGGAPLKPAPSCPGPDN